jgi:ferredoxin-NADP reductase
LTAEQIAWIESAETVFTATGYRGRGEDVRYGNDASHRGGPAGFIRVETDDADNQVVVWTEFKGNNHFNSLGNMIMDPRVGISIPNFQSGGLLQVTGTAAVEMGELSTGGRRVLTTVQSVNELPAGSLPIRWNDTAEQEEMKVQVAAIQQESDNVKSFYLAPANPNAEPWEFQAGQHLPVVLRTETGEILNRSYSLSAGPDIVRKGFYRISVKLEEKGKASSYLHDRVKVGDTFFVGKPAGDFVTGKEGFGGRTAVLLSSGIGLTPILSLLHQFVDEDKEGGKAVWVHGARNGKHHPLRREVDELVKEATRSKVEKFVFYSRPEPEDRQHDFTGRIDVEALKRLVPDWKDAVYYLCGPASFMADLEGGLEANGIDGKNIHYESF